MRACKAMKEKINDAKLISGSSSSGNLPIASMHSAENLRVVHKASSQNNAKIYFDSPVSGNCIFNVMIVGENGSEDVGFINKDEKINGLEINLKERERCCLNVEFARHVSDLALEATISKLDEVE